MGENYEQSKNSEYHQGIQTPVFSQTFSVFLTKNIHSESARSQHHTQRDKYYFRERSNRTYSPQSSKVCINFFLVKKKSGGFRPVINLKNLNQFIHTEHFTMETMKHPAAKVRALGFKVLVYLDDWILATQTRLLCLNFSISIFSKFSPEARLQNKLRKIQPGSISNKRMVRLCHQFKEHDNFFTPEKNRQSNRESPAPQNQNESLLERNKSISGSM